MPTRPPSLCACGNTNPCPTHPRTAWTGGRTTTRQRQRRYGPTWRRIRARQLADHPTCAICGAPATDADHRTPIHRGGTNEYTNLQSLCEPHHRAKTAREGVDARRTPYR